MNDPKSALLEMHIIRIANDGSDKEELGDLIVFNSLQERIFQCKTLELPWKNNESQVSCIPTGTYDVEKRHSPKYNNHFHILNVPDRDMILIHNANYYRQLKGCIAVGRQHIDIDGDGHRDVTESVQALARLYDLMPDKFKLTIS